MPYGSRIWNYIRCGTLNVYTSYIVIYISGIPQIQERERQKTKKIASLEQERIPNSSSFRRKQHKEQTYHEPNHQWNCINEFSRQNQMIAAQNIIVHQGKGKKGNQGK